MIEEAAGTRMYECKKTAAHKTIEKKEAKLKEIQTVPIIFLQLMCFIFWLLGLVPVFNSMLFLNFL